MSLIKNIKFPTYDTSKINGGIFYFMLPNYKPDTRTFQEKLAIGNKKEEYLVDILNLSKVPAKLNNTSAVTDIDIELTNDDMYIDCKLVETPFYKAKEFTGIDPDKCIPVQVRHIKAYEKKEQTTGKQCWIAFFINFEYFKVYELVFIPNSYLAHLLNNNLIREVNGKISFDRTTCRNLQEFLTFIKNSREIKLDRQKSF